MPVCLRSPLQFGALTPIEPRLGKKLIEPLTNLIHSTSAMSLLYECINTVIAVLISISSGVPNHHASIQLCVQKLRILIEDSDQNFLISISSGVPNHHASIQLCVQKLRILIEDSDQNLKYLGLLAMTKILRYHPKSVQSHKDLIFRCLDDKDESIRLRALNLVHGMVSKSNLIEIVKFLIKHVNNTTDGTHFRNELVTKIVHICSRENYQYITSFEWYISVLVELAQIDGVRDGDLLAAQLMDVAIRVPSVRTFCVTQMALLLDLCACSTINPSAGPTTSTVLTRQNALHEVVHAASWICGEYGKHLENPRQTLEAMLVAANQLPGLHSHAKCVLLLNAFKLYCMIATPRASEFRSQLGCKQAVDHLIDQFMGLTIFLVEKFALFVHSPDLEIQERAVSLHQLLCLVVKRLSMLRGLLIASVPPSADQRCSNGDTHSKELCDMTAIETHSRADYTDTTEGLRLQTETIGSHVLALGYELALLFAGEINPVAPKAQRKVPVPEGLNLDAWINPPPELDIPNRRKTTEDNGRKSSNSGLLDLSTARDKKSSEHKPMDCIFPQLLTEPPRITLTKEQLDELRQRRLREQQSNPHYLKLTPKLEHRDDVPSTDHAPQPLAGHNLPPQHSSGQPVPLSSKQTNPTPVRQFARSDQLAEEVQRKFDQLSLKETKDRRHAKTRKHKPGSTRQNGTTSAPRPPSNDIPIVDLNDKNVDLPSSPLVRVDLDMPEGVTIVEDSPDDSEDPNDPHRRLNIALDGLIDLEKYSKGNMADTKRPGTKQKRSKQNIKVCSSSRQLSNNPLLSGTNFVSTERQPGWDPSCESHEKEYAVLSNNNKSPNRGTEYGSAVATSPDPSNDERSVGAPRPKIRSSVSNGPSRSSAGSELFKRSSISVDRFTELLSTGNLPYSQSTKIRCPATVFIGAMGSAVDPVMVTNAFDLLTTTLVEQVPCIVVQAAESRACSFYTEHTALGHPVCILLKLSHQTGSISLSVKSANHESASFCMNHLKHIVRRVPVLDR
ncbi:AP-3 complex subunit delta [Paragonimus westermani]|uniref:AP-3 complex subunit delta n=1 Tax=Paragonimus westermani TaxID=34504 RepID=A0A5J4NX20_9TREM|nr:AP-3 complex subunit delta [Paragonimus westermani]